MTPRWLRRTDSAPLSKKARRSLAIGLGLFVILYAWFTISGEPNIIYAPPHLKTTAQLYGWATTLGIIASALYVHWAIKPIDDLTNRPDPHGGSAIFIVKFTLIAAWMIGQNVQDRVFFAGELAWEEYEIPIIATYEKGGRSHARGFVSLPLDPRQPLLWHFKSVDAEPYNKPRGPCIHVDLFRAKSGLVYAESNPHTGPCSRAWPSLSDAQTAYLRTYSYRSSTFLRSFKILKIFDLAETGVGTGHCWTRHTDDRLLYPVVSKGSENVRIPN